MRQLPHVESLAREYAGRVRFVKVDLDPDGTAQEQFDASILPAYLVFKDGVEVDRLGITFTAMLIEPRIRRMLDAAGAAVK